VLGTDKAAIHTDILNEALFELDVHYKEAGVNAQLVLSLALSLCVCVCVCVSFSLVLCFFASSLG
jgi:hypothetical protein